VFFQIYKKALLNIRFNPQLEIMVPGRITNKKEKASDSFLFSILIFFKNPSIFKLSYLHFKAFSN